MVQPVSPVVTTPPVDPAVEAAKREADQAKMRANQLENELKKLNDAKTAADNKQLETQNEFKTLYEQTQATLTKLQQDEELRVTAAALTAATDIAYKDYPDNVASIAKTAGISLTGETEADKAAFKAKLDAIQTQVGGTPAAVNPTNPYQPPTGPVDPQALVTRDANGVSPMAQAGARRDDSVINAYVNELPAVKRMREIANGA